MPKYVGFLLPLETRVGEVKAQPAPEEEEVVPPILVLRMPRRMLSLSLLDSKRLPGTGQWTDQSPGTSRRALPTAARIHRRAGIHHRGP